jgi:hypothetical protein
MKSETNNLHSNIFQGVHYGTVTTLPAPTRELINGFTLHQGNRIAFHGKEILLEPQQAKFAYAIMNKPFGFVTEKDELYELLGDKYVDNLARTDSAVERRYKDVIYRLNRTFSISLGIKHKFFVNKPKIGYMFNPHL